MTKRGERRARRRRSSARSGRAVLGRVLAAAALVGLCGTPASAVERHWVGGSGDWGVAGNWNSTEGGLGGAGVPGAYDYVFIRTNEAEDHTVNLAAGGGGSTVAGDVWADTFGAGALTLQLAAATSRRKASTSGRPARLASCRPGGWPASTF